MNSRTALTSGLSQFVTVGLLSLLLGALLPHSFFEDYGWVVGPGAWIVCALLSAKLVGLSQLDGIKAAAVSGIVSLIFVFAHQHLLGVISAVLLFALFCGLFDQRRKNSNLT